MSLDEPLEGRISKPLFPKILKLLIAQAIKNLHLFLSIWIFSRKSTYEQCIQSTVRLTIENIGVVFELFISHTFEILLINLEGNHFVEIVGDIVFNIVNVPINLYIQVISSWSDFTFDSGLISHEIEFVQTFGEHV